MYKKRICCHITNLSLSENFNGVPPSVTQWQWRWWRRDFHFIITEIKTESRESIDKLNGNEVLQPRRIRDSTGVQEQLTTSSRSRHKLKTQLVGRERLQWFEDEKSTMRTETDLSLLAAWTFKADRTRTAKTHEINCWWKEQKYILNHEIIVHDVVITL